MAARAKVIGQFHGRMVAMLEIPGPAEFEPLELGGEFACLVCSDGAERTDDQRVAVAGPLIASGCRYVCCVGTDADEWELAADEAFLQLGIHGEEYDRRFVMTTSHARESEADAVWFLLHATEFTGFVPNAYLILLVAGAGSSVLRRTVLGAVEHELAEG